ncbi:MAG: hypothetical protein RIC55_27495 [Pirellulaceae bacterium]
MRSDADILISVASWEERFLLGCQRLFESHAYSRAIVYYSDEYADWTQASRASVQAQCRDKGIQYEDGVLYAADTSRTWRETLDSSLGQLPEGCNAVVDLSTMPREIIWQTFWFLQYRKCNVSYVYHRPGKYGEWLSRDPDRPRLVYKMSGISRIGARTALLVLAGYDVDRVRHLVDTFEPEIALLGLQKDSVAPENSERMEAQSSAFKDDRSVQRFWVDAYSSDHGMEAVETALASISPTHNVIMASMGPKLSAVSLYRLHRQNENLGLVYLPAREFNREYSSGIGETIYGSLDDS